MEKGNYMNTQLEVKIKIANIIKDKQKLGDWNTIFQIVAVAIINESK